jgi:hypothetical protein
MFDEKMFDRDLTGRSRFQDGQFKVDWASQAYCNFTIFVAVVMFVISLVQFWRFVKFFRRGRDSRFERIPLCPHAGLRRPVYTKK